MRKDWLSHSRESQSLLVLVSGSKYDVILMCMPSLMFALRQAITGVLRGGCAWSFPGVRQWVKRNSADVIKSETG